jgi:hypothetical protein
MSSSSEAPEDKDGVTMRGKIAPLDASAGIGWCGVVVRK